MSDEDQGNEYSNGNNDRYKGLDEVYAKGGKPNSLGENVDEAMTALLKLFFSKKASDPLKSAPTAADLARGMRMLKDAKEALDIVDKELTRRWDYLRLLRMPLQCEEEGIDQIKVAGVGRIDLRADIYASIVAGQKIKAFEWLGDNGKGDVVTQTVNAQTLKAILKKMVAAGEEIPDDIFKITPFTMAALTRG